MYDIRLAAGMLFYLFEIIGRAEGGSEEVNFFFLTGDGGVQLEPQHLKCFWRAGFGVSFGFVFVFHIYDNMRSSLFCGPPLVHKRCVIFLLMNNIQMGFDSIKREDNLRTERFLSNTIPHFPQSAIIRKCFFSRAGLFL
ncbi:MAG: hypothetical protein LAT67_13575, partial [Balneolales bacterium]|nr:hypothetical protein [Balneolales bacterium]